MLTKTRCKDLHKRQIWASLKQQRSSWIFSSCKFIARNKCQIHCYNIHQSISGNAFITEKVLRLFLLRQRLVLIVFYLTHGQSSYCFKSVLYYEKWSDSWLVNGYVVNNNYLWQWLSLKDFVIFNSTKVWQKWGFLSKNSEWTIKAYVRTNLKHHRFVWFAILKFDMTTLFMTVQKV